MTVLLLGRHQELNTYRIAILEAAGFQVIAPNTREEAVNAIESGGFDVAVLSYSLSNEVVHELSDLLRQSCPRCPIVAIMDSAWADSRINPDAAVVGSDGPDALIQTLQRVSGRQLRRVK